MNRFRSLIRQSPAIAIATAALALSVAGGATAATVSGNASTPVKWHNLTLLNGWSYGGFGSFHVAYYLDANHVVHLRGSAHSGVYTKATFRLPSGIRPSHILSMPVYASNNSVGEMNILPNGQVIVFDQASGNNVRDFTSFDGVSFPLG